MDLSGVDLHFEAQIMLWLPMQIWEFVKKLTMSFLRGEGGAEHATQFVGS